jgi:hypothetical protein
LGGEFQNGVAMGPRHGENEIGVRGDPRGQLTRGESGRIATELLEHERGVGLHRIPHHGVRPGAGCPKARKLKPRAVRGGE